MNKANAGLKLYKEQRFEKNIENVLFSLQEISSLEQKDGLEENLEEIDLREEIEVKADQALETNVLTINEKKSIEEDENLYLYIDNTEVFFAFLKKVISLITTEKEFADCFDKYIKSMDPQYFAKLLNTPIRFEMGNGVFCEAPILFHVTSPAVAKMLIKYGANSNFKITDDKFKNYDCLDFMIFARKSKDTDLAECFLSKLREEKNTESIRLYHDTLKKNVTKYGKNGKDKKAVATFWTNAITKKLTINKN